MQGLQGQLAHSVGLIPGPVGHFDFSFILPSAKFLSSLQNTGS